MFSSVQARRKQDRAAAVVDIAPLIDIVFILLIFFLVTTTFVQDTGVEVNRPESVTAARVEPTSLRISIAASGAVYTEGEQVNLGVLTSRVERFVGREREHAVLMIPDASVTSGRLVEVMDAVRRGGAQSISIATERSASW